MNDNPNWVVPTPPTGDASKRTANTEFVGLAVANFTPGAGTITTTMLAAMANSTVLGNVSGASASPSALTQPQLTGLINTVTSAVTGACPVLSNSSTQFLNGVGAFAAPAGGGGGWTLLNTLTAANTATSLDDTTHLTSTYDMYAITFQTVLSTSSGVTLSLQVGTPTFVAANYSNAAISFGATSTAILTATTFINLMKAADAATTAATGMNGVIYLQQPASAVNVKQVFGQVSYRSSTEGEMKTVLVNGFWNSSTAITAFRVVSSSGNLKSGVVRLYGITNT